VRFPARALAFVVVVSLLVAACASAVTPTPSAGGATPTASIPSPTATGTGAGSPVPSPAPTESPPPEWAEQIPSDGVTPTPREDHTWTVDPASGIVYLFGGRDGRTAMADLWTFDLARNRWAQLAPAADEPSARFGHEAAWVDGVGLVVWAGQASATTFFDDLWAYEPDTHAWRELPQPGDRPSARYGSCSGLGPDGRLWISHGFTADDGRFADTWAYDFEAGSWAETTPAGRGPVERCLHGCWWTDDGRFVLYAGQTTGVAALDDLWLLEGPGTPTAAWRQAQIERPPARNLYAFARDGASTVIVGGLGNDGFLADVFRIDDPGLTPVPIAPLGEAPAARNGAALISDPTIDRLVIFGGRSVDGAFGDTWSLLSP
jgi:hypothetical protein